MKTSQLSRKLVRRIFISYAREDELRAKERARVARALGIEAFLDLDSLRAGADWRDAYPGINAVSLMELKDPPDPSRFRLIPVLTYAVERRIASGKLDYWDHATPLELAVLAKDEQGSAPALANALAVIREKFEPETTARNLRLIRETRERRGERLAWSLEIEAALDSSVTKLFSH